jgi:RNA polymerase sigma-70 factor (ECF subfamily)
MHHGSAISTQWSEIVEKIRRGDESGMQELYAVLSDGVRASLARSVGAQAMEDRLHEIVVIVLEAIQDGDLRDPERLMGFVRTVTRRRVIAHIRGAAFQRQRFVTVTGAEPCASFDQNPELCAARRQQIDRARTVLGKLGHRDREILDRFYFLEQSPKQICGEMKLSSTQFRLFKSRAIARCFDLAHPPRYLRPS